MAVNKVVYNTEEGPQTLIDLTEDSVTPETLAEGATAHDASGNPITGTLKGLDGLCIFNCTESNPSGASILTVPTNSITVPNGYRIKVGDLVLCRGFVYQVNDVNVPSETGSAIELGYLGINLHGTNGKDYELTDADKVEIANLVGVGNIPSYWQTALDEGVEAINTAVETAGRNKSAFLFYTDAHWGYGSGMSPNLLKYLGKNTAINKTIFGGDFGNTYEYPDTGKTQDDWMDVMREWKLAIRDIPNHHSVVGNHDHDIDAIESDKALYGFLFAPEETSDIVRGGDFFYYIDEPNERTRYLYLNTGLCNFSDEQCKFFIEALKTTSTEWHIVAVSHIWFVYNDTSTPTEGSVPTNIQKVLNLFDAYNARATGSMTIDSESNAYDFTECGAWVEFCIGGHAHVDYNFTSTNGIPVVLCATDSKHLRGSGYTFTLGTTTESSVSGIVADYDNKKINVIRVGRGESYEVEITNYVVSYTNVLKTSLAADGTSVYNGKGYKENTRWSQSGQNESASTGTYLTGWIPFKKGDVIRLKNMVTQSGNFFLLMSNSPGSTSGSNNYENLINAMNAAVDENGNIVQFTYNGTAPYFRISCGGIDDTSIITINEPIE